MSINNLFDHKCRIFHQITSPKTVDFGLPSTNEYSYSDVPNYDNVSCHFGGIPNVNITQNEANNTLEDRVKLILPIGTDILLNDKIVDMDTDEQYTADIPRNFRNHHITVNLRKENVQKYL